MRARVWKISGWVSVADAAFMKHTLDKLLKLSEFTIIQFVEHEFKPFGFTCVWLLAESHMAVHTFPEENRSYIELTSCNGEKHRIFEMLLKEKFKEIR
jgi:S-adenosylmethionine/arginine decarboxylase-like enzyme